MTCSIYAIASSAPEPEGHAVPASFWKGDRRSIIKIGISRSPRARLAELRTASPFQLSLIQSTEFETREFAGWVEEEAHTTLAPFRLSGEWFLLPRDGAVLAISASVTAVAIDKGLYTPSGWLQRVGELGGNVKLTRRVIRGYYGIEGLA